MRVRDFLRGFSVGMILTCCILFIVFKGSNKISDEYVIERAKQLNMVFQDEDSLFLNQDTTENDNVDGQGIPKQDATDVSVSEGTTSDKVISEQDSENSLKTEDSSDEKNTNKQDEDDNTDEKSTGETVVVNISKGMSSGDVSEMLYDLKVIDDVQEFSMYLHDNGYSLKVKIGEFDVPVDASYEEIAKIITKS